MKRILVSLLVLTPHLLLAQPRAEELEARLEGTGGRERLGLLVELAEAWRERDPARAVAFGDEASELLQSFPDEEQDLALAIALCDAHARLDQPQQALRHGTRAELLAQPADRKPQLVRTLKSVGGVHRRLGDLEAALGYFRASLRLAREIGEQRGIADNLLSIGRIHLERGNLAGGAETLRRGLAAATAVDTADSAALRGIHFSLAEAYAALGRHREAYESLRRYGELESGAVEEQRREMEAELEARLEAERRQQALEISGLQQEMAAQQQAAKAEELRMRQLALPALGVGVALLALLFFSLYSRRRLKARMSQALAESKAEHRETLTEHEQLGERYRRDMAYMEGRNADAKARLADMERFTFTVSQDMKIPLIAIRGFLGSLGQYAQAGDVERIREEARRIYDAIGKMVRLLEKLLELLQVGRIISTPEAISMSELAYEAVEQVGLVARRRIEIAIAPGMPEAVGDRAQLLEVLRHLVENAVKFMGDQPSPQLEIASRQQEPEAAPAETVYSVRDNGIGIEARYHERVFDLFERLDEGTEGLGVGLALVKRIIEAHGGRVWVESEGEGQGSTFNFTVREPHVRPGSSGGETGNGAVDPPVLASE